jgi:hypothetical protein
MKDQNIMQTIRNHTGLLGTCALLLFAGTAPGVMLTPESANFSAAGGSGRIAIGLPSPLFRATSQSPFIHVTSIETRLGRIWAVNYTVDPNYGCDRAGTLLIDGKTFPVKQGTQLAAPTGLMHTPQYESATLSWTPPPCANGTTLYHLVAYELVNQGSMTNGVLVRDVTFLGTRYVLPVKQGSRYMWTVRAGDQVANIHLTSIYWGPFAPWAYFTAGPS